MDDHSFYVPEGQGTEVSLIKWMQNAEEPVHEFMAMKYQDDVVLATVPFSSTLKKSIIAIKHPELYDTVRVYVKGAPELVLPNCLKHFDEAGTLMDFDAGSRAYLEENIMKNQMTTKGLRVIAFSYNDMTVAQF